MGQSSYASLGWGFVVTPKEAENAPWHKEEFGYWIPDWWQKTQGDLPTPFSFSSYGYSGEDGYLFMPLIAKFFNTEWEAKLISPEAKLVLRPPTDTFEEIESHRKFMSFKADFYPNKPTGWYLIPWLF